MKQRWLHALFRRRILIILLILIQAAFLGYIIISGSEMSKTINFLLRFASIIAVLYIVAKKDKGAYKTMWVFLILMFPLFGGLLYLLFRYQNSALGKVPELLRAIKKSKPLFSLPGDAYEQAKEETGSDFPQIRYLQDYAGFPVYTGTEVKYLSPGEKMLEALLPELEKAEHYIFLEFFIIHEGIMWDSILEILKRKAAQGVKVRLLYDDLGCFVLLPYDYPHRLKEMGIECIKFNPFKPLLSANQNNRDHRKIISIDGKVAFTGGINLADEYINAYEKYGHWKDSAIMVKGRAAWSFTLIFLQNFELCSKLDEDYLQYYPWKNRPCNIKAHGFVQPYADSPLDNENVGEHVYMQILNSARDYVYINTPYLIVDDSMVSALTLAAKRGVDVRIVTPHKWDKCLVHMTTRSYYRELINAGIKVYEYSSGFMHAKSFVSDDKIATVGSTNLDFRSLYLHFECGALMWNSPAVMDVKADFLETLKLCQQVKKEDCTVSPIKTLIQEILRLFAPIM